MHTGRRVPLSPRFAALCASSEKFCSLHLLYTNNEHLHTTRTSIAAATGFSQWELWLRGFVSHGCYIFGIKCSHLSLDKKKNSPLKAREVSPLLTLPPELPLLIVRHHYTGNKVYPSNGSLGCKYSSIQASFWCNSSLPIPTTFHLFILCAGTQPLQYDLALKLPSSSSLPLPSTLYSDPEHPVDLTKSSTQRSFLHPAVSTYTKEWLKFRSYPTESSASNLAFFRKFFFPPFLC